MRHHSRCSKRHISLQASAETLLKLISKGRRWVRDRALLPSLTAATGNTQHAAFKGTLTVCLRCVSCRLRELWAMSATSCQSHHLFPMAMTACAAADDSLTQSS